MPDAAWAPVAANDKDLRVLILTPHGRDAILAEQTLVRGGLSVQICANAEELCREWGAGAGCLLVAEEALPRDGVDWRGWASQEPAWLSLPMVILLGRTGSAFNRPLMRGLETRPNVSFLERPVPKRTLVSTLRAAVQSRRLQYAVRDALEELQMANQRKDEFLAVLSHELRNPIVPIRNAIYILTRLSESRDDGDKMRPVLAMADRQVDHLIRLVDDLMEIARISTGKIILQKSRVNLADVVRHAMEMSAPAIASGGHELRTEESDQSLAVDGDEVRLTQIFTNLLNNAAKYTPSGGCIQVGLRREGGEAIFRVRDNGIGINAEMLPRIFELFTQSPRSEGRKQGGIGIGLALVRNLVSLHGGTVEARSEGAGKGSEFIVRLPLAKDTRVGNGSVRQSTRGATPWPRALNQPAVDRRGSIPG